METKATKDEQSVNIQFTRDSKTSVQVDNVEEKKVQEHFDFVASRLQKLHKNVMWSMYVGRSFLDNIELVTRAQNEFCINKTVTWSKDIVNHIEDMLRLMKTLMMVWCACSVLLMTHLTVILIMIR